MGGRSAVGSGLRPRRRLVGVARRRRVGRMVGEVREEW